MTLQTLFHIGHCGNFRVEDGEEKAAGAPNAVNLYDEMMFSYQGAFSDLDQVPGIEQAFSSMMSGSHNIQMLTFGLGSIFSASKAFPLSELESLSIFKSLDPSAMMSGLSMPKVLGFTGAGGAPTRGASMPPPPQMPQAPAMHPSSVMHH